MEDKKKSPELRFAGFMEDWEEHRLGDLIDVTSAARVHKNEWTKSGVPFFRSSDVVSDYKGKPNTKAYISQELYDELSNKIGKVQKNDLLVTGGGSIGIPFLISNNDPLYFKDADLLWLKNGKNINGQFLYEFFSTKTFRKYVEKITHIGTISHYTVEQAKGTPIILPCRDEQDRVGNFIAEIDKLLQTHQKKHKRLLTLKKSMLEKMFPKEGQTVPEIRFKGFEGEWESDALNNFGSTYTGLSGKTKKDFGHGNAKYITYMNVFSNSIANPSLTDSVEIDNSQNCVEYGDVLFTVSSETPEEVGFSSVWTQNGKNTYLNSFCFGYRPSKKFDLTFLANAFRSSAFRKKIILLAQGISRFNISKTKAMDLQLCFPDYNEQVKIGLYLKDLDGLISSHRKQLQKLNNFKQSLTEKMFV